MLSCRGVLGGRTLAQSERVPFDSDAEQTVLGALVDAPVRSATALEALSPNDFHDPRHRIIYEASVRLLEEGPLDPTILKAELDRQGTLERAGGAAYLTEVLGAYGTTASLSTYANIVLDLSRRRQILRLSTETAQVASNGADPHKLAELIREQASLLDVPMIAGEAAASEVFTFLEVEEPEYDWLIPGVLERRDRLFLTGREGTGKTWLSMQIAALTAAGIHPFTLEEIEPLRVVFVDLENNPRELRRRFRTLTVKLGGRLAHDQLFILSSPAGLSLDEDGPDRKAFLAALTLAAPSLVICGPMYKMHAGDPIEEKAAKPLASFLDHIRERFDCSLIIEAHSPHDPKDKGRPYGASLWRRWPELGVYLEAGNDGKTSTLKEWRPARHETPSLPRFLTRGGEWPFNVPEKPDDIRWAQVVSYCQEHLTRPTQKELAEVVGKSVGTVNNLLKEHAEEWEEMFDES